MMLCSCTLFPNSLCITAGVAVRLLANRMTPLEDSVPRRFNANASGMTVHKGGAEVSGRESHKTLQGVSRVGKRPTPCRGGGTGGGVGCVAVGRRGVARNVLQGVFAPHAAALPLKALSRAQGCARGCGQARGPRDEQDARGPARSRLWFKMTCTGG